MPLELVGSGRVAGDQLVIDGTPTANKGARISFTRDQHKARWKEYKFPLWLYVMDALELDERDGLITSKTIDITVFCQRWEIESEADFTAAIATLQKKGQPFGFTQLHLDLYLDQ